MASSCFGFGISALAISWSWIDDQIAAWPVSQAYGEVVTAKTANELVAFCTLEVDDERMRHWRGHDGEPLGAASLKRLLRSVDEADDGGGATPQEVIGRTWTSGRQDEPESDCGSAVAWHLEWLFGCGYVARRQGESEGSPGWDRLYKVSDAGRSVLSR